MSIITNIHSITITRDGDITNPKFTCTFSINTITNFYQRIINMGINSHINRVTTIYITLSLTNRHNISITIDTDKLS